MAGGNTDIKLLRESHARVVARLRRQLWARREIIRRLQDRITVLEKLTPSDPKPKNHREWCRDCGYKMAPTSKYCRKCGLPKPART